MSTCRRTGRRFNRPAGISLDRVNTALKTLLTCAVWTLSASGPLAQDSPPASHVVIPFLANATKPSDLDFQGGQCELDASRTTMECVFQQAFLTTSDVAPDTCLITTNRYQRTFKRQTAEGGSRTAPVPARWTSSEGPEGPCGML